MSIKKQIQKKANETYQKNAIIYGYKEKIELLEKYKRELIKKETPSEKAFEKRLISLGIAHKKQRGFIRKEAFMIADFFIPALRLIIEIDGGYHQTTRQKIRDYHKDDFYLHEAGYSVLRIKNEDVGIYDLSKILVLYRIAVGQQKVRDIYDLNEVLPVLGCEKLSLDKKYQVEYFKIAGGTKVVIKDTKINGVKISGVVYLNIRHSDVGIDQAQKIAYLRGSVVGCILAKTIRCDATEKNTGKYFGCDITTYKADCRKMILEL